MKLCTLLSVAMMFSGAAAFAADGTFDRTLTVGDGAAMVSVMTGSGYVHVSAGSDKQVHVVGHVHAQATWFGGDADAKIKQIVASPPIAQSGNTVTIGDNHGDSDLYRNVAIDYDVTLPKATTLKAGTGSGGIEVTGIDGAVSASTGSGSIQANGVGANSKLTTGSGSIHASNVRGAANLHTGSGNLELSLTAAGDVRAQTGSGSIHIDGLSGGLQAGAGSGSIEVAGNPTAEWRLDSGSGGIHLKVGNSAHFNLNASTGSGSVQVDHPITMQGAIDKHHVLGAVNGGGPTIRASTGSGTVTVQ
jgi:DUF4097 and DUF4098 domain-containing protein YvlB